MKYIYIGIENTVSEIIPEVNPAFPDIPIEQRYSAEFLSHTIRVDDSAAEGITQGMRYNKETGEFYVPEVEIPETREEDLTEIVPAGKKKTVSERLAEIETALCDLDEALNGGTV